MNRIEQMLITLGKERKALVLEERELIVKREQLNKQLRQIRVSMKELDNVLLYETEEEKNESNN